MRILLTGAGGYIGGLLLELLKREGRRIRALDRNDRPQLARADERIVAPLTAETDFAMLLSGIDVVVHLADGFNAYEHLPIAAMNAAAKEKLRTLEALATAAAGRGCAMIYLSTVKAMCGAHADHILTEQSKPRPRSLYGHLKLQAERTILAIAERHHVRAVCLRFPIVFGAGAGGNMERLLRLADTPWPLPFAGLNARRSLISATGLASAVSRIIEHDDGPSGVFLVHDGALAIDDLFRLIRAGLGRPPRLFALPRSWWALAARSPRLRDIASRLCRPLELNDGLFRTTYDWQPRQELSAAIFAWASEHSQA